jgi:hypothetical protein
MLKNDPPPGTRVRFVREVRKARTADVATLVRPMRKYLVESASDQFEVDFRGETIIVERRDIEIVATAAN